MSASGFTCIDTIDTKNVLRNQVVKWVWGLAHSLLSKQGELHPERNVEHRTQDGSPIAGHFTSGDMQKHHSGEHPGGCDDSGI